MKRTCVQCGKDFFLTDSEIRFYKDKKLSLPKRCKDCREANKKSRESIADDTQSAKRRETRDAEDRKTDSVSPDNGNNNSKTDGHNGGGNKTGSAKSGRAGLAGIAAAVAILAAAGGIYSHNAAGNAVQAPQPSYEYTMEAGDGIADTADETGAALIPAGADENAGTQEAEPQYTFRNKEYLEEHYEKHGRDMGFASAAEYEAAASAVVNDPRALHKLEAEDGDDVYYIEETNEFVIVSKRGYLRTYFKPDTGKRYYDKQ